MKKEYPGKPPQGRPVLIFLKNGEVHEGHWLKNANYKQKNVNRWRIYKTGKTISDKEVAGWTSLSDVEMKEINHGVDGTADRGSENSGEERA